VTPTRTTFGFGSESSYDWENSQWTVPLTASVSQLLRLGPQPVSLALGVDYYVERPSSAPDWGMNFKITFLFPK
jgi:hypothetical protein